MCVCVCVCVCARSSSRPSNGILCLLLDESYTLQHISDIIDTTLLLDIQHICRLVPAIHVSVHARVMVTEQRKRWKNTFLRSKSPPSALFNISTNLEVSRPSDFSWRLVMGEARPASSFSESDMWTSTPSRR